ncbi:hypothetical protein HOJ01_04245 [bacterium]|jgi:hypothetical protein|nr:hypothetical protein [bacterium]MBT6293988.1 hypothetical protein [bacterium]
MKIFKPSELIDQRFPQKLDIKTCYEQSQILIQKMVQEGELYGATSYGSVPSNTHSVNSDIDWVFLFEDHNKILSSQDLLGITQIHRSFQVDFSPPIATLDSITQTFNNLFIFQSMKLLKERFIAGVDPLKVYEENCNQLEYLNSIETYMQNFYKDHLEPIIYKLNYQNSFDVFLECLEASVKAVTQMQRFMILTLFNSEGEDQFSVSIMRYNHLLRGIIPVEFLKIGNQVQLFKDNYKEYIDHLVINPINMLTISEYKDFLLHYEPIIKKSFEFCIQNLEVYKSTFSKSLNL